MAVLLSLGLVGVVAPASAAPGDVGVEGPSHTGTGSPTGTKRAESVLWYNDGFWWGNMWDTDTSDFHIFRFDAANQTWVDTGTRTEPRAETHSDVLWDGASGTLYIASHRFVPDGSPAEPNFPTDLYRYSYNSSTDTYTQLGSPTRINNYKTETLVIDKDSTGRLWATWLQDDRVYLNVTGTDGATWGTPFPHPTAPAVSSDDNAVLIAFGGPGARKIGVMWNSQLGNATDGFYWSTHTDGAAVTDWSSPTAVSTGNGSGDDHMNVKWIDSSGPRVYAAVKTSYTSSSQPLLRLLSLVDGTWSQDTIATVSECPNRVIVMIDETAQRLRTFATYPKPSGTTNAGVCTSTGGAIYEKSTPLNNIQFTTTKTARIVDADQYVHNVSSTKQNVTSSTGLVLLADVNATKRYWHYAEGAGSTPPPGDVTPPDTTITGGPSGTVTSTEAAFSFTSTEAGSTFECSLDGAAAAACTSPKSYTGLSSGSHTFTVRTRDAAGNLDVSSATRTWTIERPAPPVLSGVLYKTPHSPTIYSVNRSARTVRAISFQEWAAAGYPAPSPAPTDYVKYPWSPSIYGVTFWFADREWQWDHLGLEEWAAAGYPAPRAAGWIAGSDYYKWGTSAELFVQGPDGVKHKLTYAQWLASGLRPFEDRFNQGFTRVEGDPTISRYTNLANGVGRAITFEEWRREDYPSPRLG